MNWKRSFQVIIFLFIFCSSLYTEDAVNTCIPFNPADDTATNDVTNYLFHDMGSQITLHYTFLALGKNNNKYKVAEEIYNSTGYQELLELDFPLGPINALTYVQDFLGIEISSSDTIVITEEHYDDCEMDDNGTITFIHKDESTSYYLLQFETNGANVPFINNPALKVVSLIFLEKGNPLLGMKNSKYFPMINSNGQWKRTSMTDQIEIKRESISNAKELLQIRPWTKLTHYIVTKDSPGQNEHNRVSYSDLSEGLLVLAKEKDFYYPASISGLENNTISIRFLNSSFNDVVDNNASLISIEDLKLFFWQEGTNIQTTIKESKKWIDCTIWDLDLEEKRANVLPDKADAPVWVNLSDCRQQTGMVGNNDTADNPQIPDNESNLYDNSSMEMDEAWEKFLEYLENAGINPADLSDEEFTNLLNEMYGN